MAFLAKSDIRKKQDHQEIELAQRDVQRRRSLQDIESLKVQSALRHLRNDEMTEGSGTRLENGKLEVNQEVEYDQDACRCLE